jgi:hypothetical protein
LARSSSTAEWLSGQLRAPEGGEIGLRMIEKSGHTLGREELKMGGGEVHGV